MVGIFFYLSRAFDSLSPEFVVDKLFAQGIRGPLLGWLRSFLGDRRLRVVFAGAESDDAVVSLGVPQGSILGPLIFLLFINDLPEFLDDVHLIMYADDSSIAVAASDPVLLSGRIAHVVGIC